MKSNRKVVTVRVWKVVRVSDKDAGDARVDNEMSTVKVTRMMIQEKKLLNLLLLLKQNLKLPLLKKES